MDHSDPTLSASSDSSPSSSFRMSSPPPLNQNETDLPSPTATESISPIAPISAPLQDFSRVDPSTTTTAPLLNMTSQEYVDHISRGNSTSSLNAASTGAEEEYGSTGDIFVNDDDEEEKVEEVDLGEEEEVVDDSLLGISSPLRPPPAPTSGTKTGDGQGDTNGGDDSSAGIGIFRGIFRPLRPSFSRGTPDVEIDDNEEGDCVENDNDGSSCGSFHSPLQLDNAEKRREHGILIGDENNSDDDSDDDDDDDDDDDESEGHLMMALMRNSTSSLTRGRGRTRSQVVQKKEEKEEDDGGGNFDDDQSSEGTTGSGSRHVLGGSKYDYDVNWDMVGRHTPVSTEIEGTCDDDAGGSCSSGASGAHDDDDDDDDDDDEEDDDDGISHDTEEDYDNRKMMGLSLKTASTPDPSPLPTPSSTPPPPLGFVPRRRTRSTPSPRGGRGGQQGLANVSYAAAVRRGTTTGARPRYQRHHSGGSAGSRHHQMHKRRGTVSGGSLDGSGRARRTEADPSEYSDVRIMWTSEDLDDNRVRDSKSFSSSDLFQRASGDDFAVFDDFAGTPVGRRPSSSHQQETASEMNDSVNTASNESAISSIAASSSSSNSSTTRRRRFVKSQRQRPVASRTHTSSSSSTSGTSGVVGAGRERDGTSRQLQRQQRRRSNTGPTLSTIPAPAPAPAPESSSTIRSSLDAGMATLRRWLSSRAAASGPRPSRAAMRNLEGQNDGTGANTTNAALSTSTPSAFGHLRLGEEDVFALSRAGSASGSGVSFHHGGRDSFDPYLNLYDEGRGRPMYPPTIQEFGEEDEAAMTRQRAFSEPSGMRIRSFFFSGALSRERRRGRGGGSASLPPFRSQSAERNTPRRIGFRRRRSRTRDSTSESVEDTTSSSGGIIPPTSPPDSQRPLSPRYLTSALASSSLFQPHAASNQTTSSPLRPPRSEGDRVSFSQDEMESRRSDGAQDDHASVNSSRLRRPSVDPISAGDASGDDNGDGGDGASINSDSNILDDGADANAGDDNAAGADQNSPVRTEDDATRVARARWIRINSRFQRVITIVAMVFSLLLFAVLVCWIVLTSAYIVSFDKQCDLPLKRYYWLATLQLLLDVFRTDIMRFVFQWDASSRERIPARVIMYNIAYLTYAMYVLGEGVSGVFLYGNSLCPKTAPALFQASTAFVTLSLMAWTTIVLGYLGPFCFVAIILTRNGYSPQRDAAEGGGEGRPNGIHGVFPSAFSAASGAPPDCVERMRVVLLEEFPDEYPRDCCICMGDFVAGEVIVATECEHVFHKQCCMEWLRQARTCPVCRTDIPNSFPSRPNPTTNTATTTTTDAAPESAQQQQQGSTRSNQTSTQTPAPSGIQNRVPPFGREDFHHEVVNLLRILRQHEERMRTSMSRGRVDRENDDGEGTGGLEMVEGARNSNVEMVGARRRTISSSSFADESGARGAGDPPSSLVLSATEEGRSA